MKLSLGISNFLEEISSLPYSIVFLFFLHYSLRKSFLSLLLFFGTLHWDGYICPFLLCLSPSLLFSAIWQYGLQQIVVNPSRDVNTRPPYLPPEKPVCRSRSNFRTKHGKLSGSKLSKEYGKAVHCLSACLSHKQSSSYKMLVQMNHKLESRCWEKCQQSQICRWYHSNGK